MEMPGQNKNPTKKRRLTREEIGFLIFIPSVLFGAYLRLYLPAISGFPINDGALFLKMIEGIQQNNFALPFYVDYNRLEIPFAYPPLAFYIAGAVGVFFRIPSIQVITWMPAIVLALTLPFVFHLARLVTNSTFQAGIAIFFYAFLPRTAWWLIMGGGVTRSLGNLFLVLAASQLYLLITRKQRIYIISSIIFCSLVCLSHPEAALHTAMTGALIWFIFDKKIGGVKNGLVVALGTLTLTSPWWALIVSRFGFSPFLSAGKTGFHSFVVIFQFLDNFAGEQLLTFISVLAFLGLFHQVSKRQAFLPAWFILPFILEPRNAPNVVVIPMCILASVYLTETVLPGLSANEQLVRGTSGRPFAVPTAAILFAYLSISLLVGMFMFDFNLSTKKVSADTLDAFEWINNNTPKEAGFLVITGSPNLFSDHNNEWFPYLADRKSLTTIQGMEWLQNIDFEEKNDLLIAIQNCVNSPETLECIETNISENRLDFDYIVVQKNGKNIGNLLSELLREDSYKKVYETAESAVFLKQPGRGD